MTNYIDVIQIVSTEMNFLMNIQMIDALLLIDVQY